MGDITALIPKEEIDICILEEPEHLNWYRAPGDSWTDKFKHVVGIIHTNYFVYAQDQPAAFVRVSLSFDLDCSMKYGVILFSKRSFFKSQPATLTEGTGDASFVFMDVPRSLSSYN